MEDFRISVNITCLVTLKNHKETLSNNHSMILMISTELSKQQKKKKGRKKKEGREEINKMEMKTTLTRITGD